MFKKIVIRVYVLLVAFVNIVLGIILFWALRWLPYYNDGAPYYEQNAYRKAILELILDQASLIFWALFVSVIWVLMVWVFTSYILHFYLSANPNSIAFTKLKPKLTKLTFVLMLMAILGANLVVAYDQFTVRHCLLSRPNEFGDGCF